MRFVFFTTMLVACASEADVVLELHRVSTGSELAVGVCDMDHPDDCLNLRGLVRDRTVVELGIYLDAPIEPPLTVNVLNFDPQTCNIVEFDPAIERDVLVIQLPESESESLAITGCSNCVQRECPDR
ncbi:MAG TPA: hypothetical protein VM261_11625 [Kofleriaceae bacterium]|nr:hypothetical protein [Kofleriaceae bacterium]